MNLLKEFEKEAVKESVEESKRLDKQLEQEKTMKSESIYKPVEELINKGYKYSNTELYCPIHLREEEKHYLSIKRGTGKYRYSICALDDNNKPAYITKGYESEKPITVEDPNRNRKFGQWLKKRVEKNSIVDGFNKIALDLINTTGFEQITEEFKEFNSPDRRKKEMRDKGFEQAVEIDDLSETPTKETTILAVSSLLEKKFNIKKITTPKVSYYYLNEEKGLYEELDKHKVSLLLKKVYGYNFGIKTTQRILDGIVNNNKVCNKYINAKNGLINKKNGQLESKDKLKDYLILDTFRVETESEETLLNYVEDAKLFNENETLVEKTLKQICIPKNNKEDNKIYIDRLQRTGANILGRKRKSIAYYYTQHQNTGKSALRSLNSLIMDCAVVNPAIFKDNFNYNQIGNKKAILIDETQKGQLEGCVDQIKLMSSPDTRQDNRLMYTDKTVKVNFGNLEVFTNYPIKLNIDEKALFYRLDIIQLPNQFIDTEEQAKNAENAYILNNDLFDNSRLIEKDIKGLEWFGSIAIQEYIRMEETKQEYTCRQTTEQTMDILLNVDHLTSFIAKYTVEDPDEITTNKEIKLYYQNWLELKGIQQELNDKDLSKEIGVKIREIYGEELKTRDSRGVKYKLKLKTMEEVETEYKQVWETDEDNYTEKQTELLDKLTTDQKTIFTAIKNGKYNTINQLHNQYSNIQVIEHVQTLERLGLIYNTFNTRIE